LHRGGGTALRLRHVVNLRLHGQRLDLDAHPGQRHGGDAVIEPAGSVVPGRVQLLLSETINFNWPQAFSLVRQYSEYDRLNRLVKMTEGGSEMTFVYDRYGNRAQWNGAGQTILSSDLTPQVSERSESAVEAQFPRNRWQFENVGYDASGNLTALPERTMGYDGENRMVASMVRVDGTPIDTTYRYDGEGRRVKKDNTYCVYDAFGNLAAEYGGPTAATRQYVVTDHLGSTRLVVTGNTVKRYDYAPFGEELAAGTNGRTAALGYQSGGDGLNPKFTGKERDAETGLDYFGARYFSGSQGRFTSPDEPVIYSDAENPQSWNLYAYVGNNPLGLVDPDGHMGHCPNGVDESGTACKPHPVDIAVLEIMARVLIRQWEMEKRVKQVVRPVMEWASQPRDMGCLAAATASGSAAGASVGMLGLAGGPTVAITAPTGFAVGGAGGWVAGMIACSSNSGASGSGTSSGGGQDRKLSPSEIRKLERTTGESAHQIKTEALGTNKKIAQYDLYKDSQGNVFVKGKGGVGEAIPTGLKIN
jgi:RHS repeat-associated protein